MRALASIEVGSYITVCEFYEYNSQKLQKNKCFYKLPEIQLQDFSQREAGFCISVCKIPRIFERVSPSNFRTQGFLSVINSGTIFEHNLLS